MADIFDLNKEKANGRGEYEYCVICWQKTGVKKNTPVDKRLNYIEGVGHLCQRCYKKQKFEE